MSPKLRSLLFAIAGVAALVALGFQARSWFAAPPEKKAESMYARGGSVMAELVREVTGGKGDVLLIEPDVALAGNEERQRWLHTEIESFEKDLGAQTIAGRTTLGAVVSRLYSATNRPAGLTLRMCEDLAKPHPQASVLVSFVGAPMPGTKSAALPPLVCFAPQGTHVERLMADGLLKAAVVPRVTAVPMAKASGDWFETMYEVVTPANVAAWARAFSSPPTR